MNDAQLFREVVRCQAAARQHGLSLEGNGDTLAVVRSGKPQGTPRFLYNARSVGELVGWLECYHSQVAKDDRPMGVP